MFYPHLVFQGKVNILQSEQKKKLQGEQEENCL
jgi:hypothetical protein